MYKTTIALVCCVLAVAVAGTSLGVESRDSESAKLFHQFDEALYEFEVASTASTGFSFDDGKFNFTDQQFDKWLAAWKAVSDKADRLLDTVSAYKKYVDSAPDTTERQHRVAAFERYYGPAVQKARSDAHTNAADNANTGL